MEEEDRGWEATAGAAAAMDDEMGELETLRVEERNEGVEGVK